MEIICGMKVAGVACFQQKAMETVGSGCWVFTSVWFVSSLTAAGPPCLWHSSSSAGQQTKLGVGLLILTFGSTDPWWEQWLAAKAQLEEPCPAELLVLLCWCLWGPALPSLLCATLFSPVSLPKCASLCDSNDNPHMPFPLLTDLLKASFSPCQLVSLPRAFPRRL